MIGNKQFEVKQTGNRFYYYSPLAGRWFPVSKSRIIKPEPVEEYDWLNDWNNPASRHHY
jgi:hypothetical protein